MTPDIQKLKPLANSKLGRAIFALFADRIRARAHTNVVRLRRILREESKVDADAADILKFFEKLETVGVGRLSKNRRNFEWKYSCISVAGAAAGKGTPEKQRDPKVRLPLLEPATEENAVAVVAVDMGKLIIRKGNLVIEAPTVMTGEERKRVREFLSDISIAS